MAPFLEDVGPTVTIPPSAVEIFKYFLTDSICEMIVTQSNLYAKEAMGKEKYSEWVKVSVEELRAYFGLRILMGIVKLPALSMYWSKDTALNQHEVTSRISRNRFQEITRYIHFADNSTLTQRGQPGYDRLGKVRPVMKALKERFLANYSPNCEQAVDEAMISFQGRSSLKQYLPAKPVKRGIKVWCRADSHNGYLSEIQVYTGQSATGEREVNLGGRVALDLARRLEGKHYHLYFDNFFTSYTLLSSLLSKGVYACGTARQGYRGFPESLKMKNKGKREERRLGLLKRYIQLDLQTYKTV